MARSVSYPRNAVVAFDSFDPDPEFGFEDFQLLVEDYCHALSKAYPAGSPREKWLGREDRVVFANALVYFGISEYGGTIAYWAVVRDDTDYPALAESYLKRIAPNFEARFGTLRRLGAMSNGEVVYARIGGGGGLVA
jgi:hypothetical protein